MDKLLKAVHSYLTFNILQCKMKTKFSRDQKVFVIINLGKKKQEKFLPSFPRDKSLFQMYLNFWPINIRFFIKMNWWFFDIKTQTASAYHIINKVGTELN